MLFRDNFFVLISCDCNLYLFLSQYCCSFSLSRLFWLLCCFPTLSSIRLSNYNDLENGKQKLLKITRPDNNQLTNNQQTVNNENNYIYLTWKQHQQHRENQARRLKGKIATQLLTAIEGAPQLQNGQSVNNETSDFSPLLFSLSLSSFDVSPLNSFFVSSAVPALSSSHIIFNLSPCKCFSISYYISHFQHLICGFGIQTEFITIKRKQLTVEEQQQQEEELKTKIIQQHDIRAVCLLNNVNHENHHQNHIDDQFPSTTPVTVPDSIVCFSSLSSSDFSLYENQLNSRSFTLKFFHTLLCLPSLEGPSDLSFQLSIPLYSPSIRQSPIDLSSAISDLSNNSSPQYQIVSSLLPFLHHNTTFNCNNCDEQDYTWNNMAIRQVSERRRVNTKMQEKCNVNR